MKKDVKKRGEKKKKKWKTNQKKEEKKLDKWKRGREQKGERRNKNAWWEKKRLKNKDHMWIKNWRGI